MFSYNDETNPLIAAVSAPSAARSMLAVQQQRRLCRQFDEALIGLSQACVQEATCEPASTACTEFCQRLASSATLEEPESQGYSALRPRTVRAAACKTRWNGVSVEAPASTALQ